MKMLEVVMVRVYVMEKSGMLAKILDCLHHKTQVRGVSVFRAIQGFGETGEYETFLLDLSLNLPLAIEFFDERAKVDLALELISSLVKPEHIVCWDANTVV